MEILVQQAAGGRAGPATTTTWRTVQPGIWVGRRGGAFAGMVEQRLADGFVATTRLGKSLGTFTTVEEAQRALR
jgi:hypothetical protein